MKLVHTIRIAVVVASMVEATSTVLARLSYKNSIVDGPVDPGCTPDYPCSGSMSSCYKGKCPATGSCSTGLCSCSSDYSCVGAYYGTLSTPFCSNCGFCSTISYIYGCDGGAIAGTVIAGLVLLTLAIVLSSVYAPCCRCCYKSCACCCCCCSSCSPQKTDDSIDVQLLPPIASPVLVAAQIPVAVPAQVGNFGYL